MPMTKQQQATKNYEMLFDMYLDRKQFISRFKESRDFRIHKQWTEKESDTLRKAGMIDYPLNRIRPNYRNKKAVIMSKRPTIKITSVRGRDTDAVTEFQRLIYYIWNISNGVAESQRMLDGYFDAGMGILQVYEDPEADFGRGELKIRECDPEYIYLPRSASQTNYDDAKNLFYAKYIPLEEALSTYGHLRGVNEESLKNQSDLTAAFIEESVHYAPERQTIDQGLEGDLFFSTENLILIAERYEKIRVDRTVYRILNDETGNIGTYIAEPGTDIEATLAEKGIPAFTIDDQETTKITRVKRTVTAGVNIHLHEEVMPISKFPFGFCVGEDTRNPYPVGDVFFNIGSQKMVNHLASLITLIGQTVAIPRMVTKEGAFRDAKHKAEVMANMSVPSYIPELAIETNEPIGNYMQISQGGVIPPVLGQLLQMNIGQIDYDTAVFPLSMGDPSETPNTAFGTASVSEFNNRMTQIPLLAMQICFERVFNVLAEWIPNYYDIEKYFEVVEGEKISKGAVNVKDTSSEKLFSDITNMEAKVHVQVGSHMSVSKVVSQLLYKDLANVNPIFIKLLLQNEDSIDEDEKKALIAEMDEIPKLQQQLAEAEEMMEKLAEALQDVDAERLHQIERTHVERLRGNLKVIQERAKSDADKAVSKVESKNGENK